MLVLLGVVKSGSLDKPVSGRGDLAGAVNSNSEVLLFQAFDNGLKVDAPTNPSNRGRHVHSPMRIIDRIRLIAADIRKRLNDFLNGNAGVKLSHYPSPIAL